MTLLETIRNNSLIARKSRNTVIAKLLSTVLGEINTLEKNRPDSPITDADVIKIAKKMAESARETVGLLQQASQNAKSVSPNVLSCFQESVVDIQRIADLWTEINHLEGMLPQMMTEDKLKTVIEVLVANGATNIGTIMAALKIDYAGKYDGKLASAVAKKVLSS